MSAHVLLSLLNELGKRNKMRGLPIFYVLELKSEKNHNFSSVFFFIFTARNKLIILIMHVFILISYPGGPTL